MSPIKNSILSLDWSASQCTSNQATDGCKKYPLYMSVSRFFVYVNSQVIHVHRVRVDIKVKRRRKLFNNRETWRLKARAIQDIIFLFSFFSISISVSFFLFLSFRIPPSLSPSTNLYPLGENIRFQDCSNWGVELFHINERVYSCFEVTR